MTIIPRIDNEVIKIINEKLTLIYGLKEGYDNTDNEKVHEFVKDLINKQFEFLKIVYNEMGAEFERICTDINDFEFVNTNTAAMSEVENIPQINHYVIDALISHICQMNDKYHQTMDTTKRNEILAVMRTELATMKSVFLVDCQDKYSVEKFEEICRNIEYMIYN